MAGQFQKQNRERQQFWQSHIDAWALTGLSQAQYCRQNDLKPFRFTYWKRKFHKECLPVEFVQIPTEPIESEPADNISGAHLRLNVGSRFAIEISDGFSPATLEQVLLTLRGI